MGISRVGDFPGALQCWDFPPCENGATGTSRRGRGELVQEPRCPGCLLGACTPSLRLPPHITLGRGLSGCLSIYLAARAGGEAVRDPAGSGLWRCCQRLHKGGFCAGCVQHRALRKAKNQKKIAPIVLRAIKISSLGEFIGERWCRAPVKAGSYRRAERDGAAAATSKAGKSGL